MTQKNPQGGGQIEAAGGDVEIPPGGAENHFLAALMNAAVDGMIVAGRGGTVQLVNKACCRMFGYEPAELLGGSINRLMTQPDLVRHDQYVSRYLETGEKRIIDSGRQIMALRSDGSVFPIHLSVGHARFDGDDYFVAIIRDISDKLEAERRAHYLERHDPLTGVFSRKALMEEAAALEARGRGDDGGTWAWFSIDVDQFSDVNEAFGQLVGDMSLKTLVVRIAEALPDGAVVGRIAADEFAALSPVADADDAVRIGREMFDRLSASMHAGRHWLRLRVSMGVAVLETGADDIDQLSARSKLALQSAQQNGGASVCFYTPEMAAAAARRMMLTLQLTHALERRELYVVYQPIVRSDGVPAAAEALLRWRHPTLGSVSPAEFIPVAEESGLIIPISEWVFEQVATDVERWVEQGARVERVFVNVSGLQFLRGNLVHKIKELLARRPALRGRLGLEITEQAAVRDLAAAVDTISQLGAYEVLFAIDDFGTGYSSLSYVQQLPVAKLKIDRAFVIDVPENARNAALVRAVIGMAHGLGLTTVAEGVETAEQRDYLASVGCDFMQGYLFGKPMSPDDLVALSAAAS